MVVAVHAAVAAMLSTLALTTALATPSSQALRSAWDRGEGATALRPIVEAAGSGTAAAVASSTVGWKGLWLARIEHFEKVKFTGLKVNPHYGLDDEGGIIVACAHLRRADQRMRRRHPATWSQPAMDRASSSTLTTFGSRAIL